MSNNQNVIMMLLDELVLLDLLPKHIQKEFKGFNAFKKLGVNFTNYHTNTQMCSPSRTTYMTGVINHGIIDNVEQEWQYQAKEDTYDYKSVCNCIKETNKNIICAYYGKVHLDSKLIPTVQINPRFRVTTNKSLNIWDIDYFNTFGDGVDFAHGLFIDSQYIQGLPVPPDTPKSGYNTEINGIKRQGTLDFLDQMKKENKRFFLQHHFQNPHDIQYYRMNPKQKTEPVGDFLPFPVPFLEEQLKDWDNDYYYFNKDDKFAFITLETFKKNWFEDNYEEYKTNKDSLLFSETLGDFYFNNPKYNTINPFYLALSQLAALNFSMPEENDIALWKNYQNTYLNILKHVDNYILMVYNKLEKLGFLENTSVIICADHGDALGSFGLIEKGFVKRLTENIPLIIYSPYMNNELRGQSSDYLCSTIDMNFTIYNLLFPKVVPTCLKPQMIGQSILQFNEKCNKFEINCKQNKYTFCFISNWMLWTSTFLYFQQRDKWHTLYDENPDNYLYKINHPLQLANNQLSINTIYNNKKYKYTIWFNFDSFFYFDKNLLKLDISLDTWLQFENNIMEFFSNKNYDQKIKEILIIYIERLKTNTIRQKYSSIEQLWIDTIKQKIPILQYIGISVLFGMLSTLNKDSKNPNLKIFKMPIHELSFDEFNTCIDNKKFFYQELYNITDDPLEKINLVDFKREKSIRDENLDLIKCTFFPLMQEALITNNIAFPKITIWIVKQYLDSLLDLLQNNILEFRLLTKKQIYNFTSLNGTVRWDKTV